MSSYKEYYKKWKEGNTNINSGNTSSRTSYADYYQEWKKREEERKRQEEQRQQEERNRQAQEAQQKAKEKEEELKRLNEQVKAALPSEAQEKIDKLNSGNLTKNEEFKLKTELSNIAQREATQKLVEETDGLLSSENGVELTLADINAEEAAQKRADQINKAIDEGDYLTVAGYWLEGIPEGMKSGIAGIGEFGLNTLASDLDRYGRWFNNEDLLTARDKLIGTSKDLRGQTSYYTKTNSKIKNNIARTGGSVSNTIGEMIPSIAANAVLPGSGVFVTGTQVAGQSSTDEINLNRDNLDKAVLTGTAKGTVAGVVEKIVGGDFISEGLADKLATKGISKVTTNKFAQNLLWKSYQVGGEVLEENVEDSLDDIIDAVINEKDLPTLEEKLNQIGETSKITGLSTLVLNALGLGGGNFDTSVQETQISDLNNDIKKLDKQISKETDTVKIDELNQELNWKQKQLDALTLPTANTFKPTIKENQELPTAQERQELPKANNQVQENTNELPVVNKEKTITNNIENSNKSSFSFDEINSKISNNSNKNKLSKDGITMTYVHMNNQNTQNYGTLYGQNIEPSGEYMNVDTMEGKYKVPNADYGTIHFDNPLILDHINTGETGWKKTLSEMFENKTGKELSNAIKNAGYDGIITIDEDGYYNEVVNLNGKKDNSTSETNKEQSKKLPQVQEGYTRLYRGLDNEYNPQYDKTKLDNSNGYESWTDNYDLAKSYGNNVYYIDVPSNEIKNSIIDEDSNSETYGDRNLLYKNDKPVGINGKSGNEYMLYTDHDNYNNIKYNKVGNTLENRVSGDELLNAQDLVEELKNVGAKVDNNGYVTVYHQTTEENANNIIKSGKMSAKEDGVFFSTSKDASQADGRGNTKLEFKIPAEKLVLDDIFDNNADVKIPLTNKNETVDISDYLVYNNNESESGINENSRRNQQDDKRRVQELLEKYTRGEETLSTGTKNIFGEQSREYNVTESEVKLALIDYAKKYKKTQLNENEQHLKSIINKLNGDVVFYEFGDNNINQGLADTNTFYIDTLGDEKVENVFYHEITHYLRQNKNEIYNKEIQPIVNDIATKFENQEYIYKYATSKEDFDINKLNGTRQNELAEEVVADNVANMYGDLQIDYELPKDIRTQIKQSMDKIFNQSENLNESEVSNNGEQQIRTENGKLQEDTMGKLVTGNTEVYERIKELNRNVKKEIAGERTRLNDLVSEQLDQLPISKTRKQQFIRELANNKTMTQDDIRTFLENNNKYTEKDINEDLRNVRKDISSYSFKLDNNIKSELKYKYDKIPRNIKLSNNGLAVDQIYQELNSKYPDIFSDEIKNNAEQAIEIIEFMRNADPVSINETNIFNDEEIDRASMLIYAYKQNFDEAKNYYGQYFLNEKNKIKKNFKDESNKKLTRKDVRQKLFKEMNITENDLNVGNDIKSLNYQFTDPVRVNEKVFGKELGDKINDVTVNKTKHNTAEKTRWLKKERAEIKDLGIKPRSKESAAVQKYGEKQWIDKNGDIHQYGNIELANEFPDVKTQEKIKKAAEVIRNKYDTYIDEINGILTQLGYDEIPKRTDYMRHFQELGDIFSKTGVPFNLNDMKAEDLPTDINGLTEFNKPGKNWFANAQHRYGIKTNYDAITGIDGYLEGAGNLIFHTEDIQNYRALSEAIRNQFGQTKGFENLENLSDAELKQRIEDIQNNKLSKYVAWLDEQANNLAGKKGAIDRGVERFLGRRGYKLLNTLKSQVGSNMTGYNVRSSLTNFISSTIAAAKTNKIAMVKGTISTINNMFKNDGFIDKSDFLTSRFGSKPLSQKMWQKISNAGQIFMEGTDYFTANLIARSKYYEGLQKGMTEKQALEYSNDFSSRVMGDRSQGSTPEAFNSKTLGLFTQFQLEVNNQWQYMLHDTKMDYQQNVKNKGALKAGATTLFQMGQLAAYSYFFNELFKKVTGNRAAFDPIQIFKTLFGLDDEDKDKTFDERMSKAGSMLVDNIPFGNLITGGGRIPISEAFNGIGTLGKKLTNQTDKYGNKITWSDVGEDITGSLPYWVLPTGYGQGKKTFQGLKTVANNGDYKVNSKGEKELRFPVENKNASTYLQAGLFGKYALPTAQEYINNNYKKLSASQTKTYEESKVPYTEYLEYINQNLPKAEDKISYINSTNWNNNQKWNIYKNDVLSDTERKDGGTQKSDAEYITSHGVNKTDYMNLYSKSKEKGVDFPTKEEYIKIKDSGLSLNTYIDYKINENKGQLKDKDKINILLNSTYSNKEKSVIYENYINKEDDIYQILKETDIDIDQYLKYKQQEFTADKTLSGKSVSGSKKEKVWNYIENMKITYMQKLLLYGTQYALSDNEQTQIVNYINSLNKTRQQKLDMLSKYKGFTIYKDGTFTY